MILEQERLSISLLHSPTALTLCLQPDCFLVPITTCRVFFFIAEVCLLAGSVRNAYHTKYRTIFSENPPSCQTVRKGVFGAGAAFIFFNAIVSEFYYICYSKAQDSFLPYGPGGREPAVGLSTYK